MEDLIQKVKDLEAALAVAESKSIKGTLRDEMIDKLQVIKTVKSLSKKTFSVGLY